MRFVPRPFAAAIVACAVAIGLLAVPVRAEEFELQQLELFEKQIRPLLVDHCLKCHGPEKQEGGLNLATRESLLKGGDSGAALVAGKPAESLLVAAVEYLGDPIPRIHPLYR